MGYSSWLVVQDFVHQQYYSPNKGYFFTCLNATIFFLTFFEAELDLAHSDQRRVLHLLWCIAEKERIENLQDVVSWVQKSVFFFSMFLEKGRPHAMCSRCLNIRAAR